MLRAILDLEGYSRKTKTKKILTQKRINALSAWKWIHNNRKQQINDFLCVCELVNISPDIVRRSVKHLNPEPR